MTSTRDLTTAVWRKSSYSDGGDNNCVEVANTPATIHIRDSKTPDTPYVTVASTTWASFLTYVTD
ncbi:DUF397 domain-containing protein [Streptomyces sp. NPDC008137]|uniref:DUF397 domain-containing protein n=1 Tax=Streptomyces sp. NPDC008137 TaxID=3364813 RepID=UPI0036E62BAD